MSAASDAAHIRALFDSMRERDATAQAELVAAMHPMPGESGADHAARVTNTLAPLAAQRAEVATADRAALAVAAQQDEPGQGPQPEPQPSTQDDAWRAALAAAARSAAANPKAWALIRGVLGASFPAPSLDPAKRAGAARLEALCIAAAAAESRIASVESAAAAAWLTKHFEPRPGQQPQSIEARDSGTIALLGAIDACRVLWSL